MKICKLLLTSAALIFLISASACDLSKTGSQLTSKTVIVATLLGTPAITIGPEAIAFDAGQFLPDGGFDFDGGLPFDAGALMVTIPPQAGSTVFFGTLNGVNDTSVAPTGLEGGQATVQAGNAAAITMIDETKGNFRITSVDDGGFLYQPLTTYRFNVAYQGANYTAKIDESPQVETISEFHPAIGYIDQAAGSDFTFHRPDPPAGEDRNLGFVAVFPIDQNGEEGQTTYTNLPQTPLAYLKLVIAPLDWKQTTVTIPGTAFPDPGKNYVILLQSAKLGGPESDNLFSGSAILAGSADVGVVKTH